MEETHSEKGGEGWGTRECGRKKVGGVGHLTSQRKEVGDSKRPRREPEERIIRVKLRGNRSSGT